jgi:CRP-like cAMP-binding protein
MTGMASHIPAGNKLLAALPQKARERVLAELTSVNLKLGEVLYEPGKTIRQVYFPINCIICVVSPVAGQKPVEVGCIGYEGMLGLSVALGVPDSFVRALVRSSGTAVRISAARFRQQLLQFPSFQRELHRYANWKLAMVRQTVACHCFHQAEARLACWLLMTSDRVRSEEFLQDQDSLAAMLGITRPTVSICAGRLRQRKLINYSRGKIRIIDRDELEAAACDCYQYGKVLNTLSGRSVGRDATKVTNGKSVRRNQRRRAASLNG